MTKTHRFYLGIRMENAAFDDNPSGALAAILRDVAREIERDGLDRVVDDERSIRDTNGNRVGKYGMQQVTP